MKDDDIVSLADNDGKDKHKLAIKEDFKPTPKMRDWLVASVEQMSDSPSKVARHCNVARNTWYSWIEVPGFETWFYKEYKKHRRKILPKLDSIGMKEAKQGNFKFWEAMNKKIGELIDDKTNPVNIQVNNTIQKQREAYEID